MENWVELGIEQELLDALRTLSHEQGTTVTTLINLAVKEFVLSMEDQLELCYLKHSDLRA